MFFVQRSSSAIFCVFVERSVSQSIKFSFHLYYKMKAVDVFHIICHNLPESRRALKVRNFVKKYIKETFLFYLDSKCNFFTKSRLRIKVEKSKIQVKIPAIATRQVDTHFSGIFRKEIPCNEELSV